MNAQMKNENVVENATTPCFTYDHINHKIVGTELNFRKSGIPGSAQDVELMARLAEHPDYTFQITGACAVWYGERQGQGQADRPSANNQRQHSRNLSTALPSL